MAEPVVRALQQPLRVSQLTRYLKYMIEQDEVLGALSVEGEICEFSQSAAGHTYFGLKDATSQVSCVLFRREAAGQHEQVKQLRKGISVVVHGFLTVYESRGAYQIYVERVVVVGDGAAFQRFERLRQRLEAEGLFSLERKRPLPQYPRSLALVTSPGSQAYHDVLHRLGTQYPFVRVIEVGVSVQGDGAADEMAMAIDVVNRLTSADVILLVRGGGAPEDLAAFNEERLARAIYASRIPVVTGIGHETDQSIADLVADYRAATPSLAAAAAVPDVRALVDRVLQLHRQVANQVGRRLADERRHLRDVNTTLLRASPQSRLRQHRQRADEICRFADRAMQMHLRRDRARLEALRAQLRALDPLAILGRGYSVLTDVETGWVVAGVAQAQPGTKMRAQVSDGEFTVRVDD